MEEILTSWWSNELLGSSSDVKIYLGSRPPYIPAIYFNLFKFFTSVFGLVFTPDNWVSLGHYSADKILL